LKIVWKNLDEIQPGAICGDDIFDPNSFVLLAHKSSVLDSKTLDFLKNHDVTWIPIQVKTETAGDKELAGKNIALDIEDKYAEESKPLAPNLPLILSDEKYHETISRFNTLAQDFIKNKKLKKDELMNLSNEMVNEVLKTKNSVFNFMTDVAPGFIIKHGINTAIIASMLGKSLKQSRHLLVKITKVAMLHDLGLIYAKKESTLDFVEDIVDQYRKKDIDRIKIHPILSIKIINKVSPGFLDKEEENAILEHHERYDGKGFPMGAKGKKINYISRILSIADAYDTLMSTREGKSGMNPYNALKWIVSNTRKIFDPDIVNVFVKLVGLYPTGTKIRLSNGKEALVISKGEKSIGRPIVLLDDEELNLEDYPELFVSEVLDIDKVETDQRT